MDDEFGTGILLHQGFGRTGMPVPYTPLNNEQGLTIFDFRRFRISSFLVPCSNFFSSSPPLRFSPSSFLAQKTNIREADVDAGLTRLELATSGVTGRCSNQLNYSPVKKLTIIRHNG